MFYEVELLTEKKNLFINCWISNSKCDVIQLNSIYEISNLTDKAWVVLKKTHTTETFIKVKNNEINEESSRKFY